MRSLMPLYRWWRIFILRWALKEIDPMHPDVSDIVLELHEWENCYE
jgi:hypothetical protein